MLRAIRLAQIDFRIENLQPNRFRDWQVWSVMRHRHVCLMKCLKMFLSGHAEKSFLGLENHGLLNVLFHETAKALNTNTVERCVAMVLQALLNTDRVSPRASRLHRHFCLPPAMASLLPGIGDIAKTGVDPLSRHNVPQIE